MNEERDKLDVKNTQYPMSAFDGIPCDEATAMALIYILQQLEAMRKELCEANSIRKGT